MSNLLSHSQVSIPSVPQPPPSILTAPPNFTLEMLSTDLNALLYEVICARDAHTAGFVTNMFDHLDRAAGVYSYISSMRDWVMTDYYRRGYRARVAAASASASASANANANANAGASATGVNATVAGSVIGNVAPGIATVTVGAGVPGVGGDVIGHGIRMEVPEKMMLERVTEIDVEKENEKMKALKKIEDQMKKEQHIQNKDGDGKDGELSVKVPASAAKDSGYDFEADMLDPDMFLDMIEDEQSNQEKNTNLASQSESNSGVVAETQASVQKAGSLQGKRRWRPQPVPSRPLKLRRCEDGNEQGSSPSNLQISDKIAGESVPPTPDSSVATNAYPVIPQKPTASDAASVITPIASKATAPVKGKATATPSPGIASINLVDSGVAEGRIPGKIPLGIPLTLPPVGMFNVPTNLYFAHNSNEADALSGQVSKKFTQTNQANDPQAQKQQPLANQALPEMEEDVSQKVSAGQPSPKIAAAQQTQSQSSSALTPSTEISKTNSKKSLQPKVQKQAQTERPKKPLKAAKPLKEPQADKVTPEKKATKPTKPFKEPVQLQPIQKQPVQLQPTPKQPQHQQEQKQMQDQNIEVVKVDKEGKVADTIMGGGLSKDVSAEAVQYSHTSDVDESGSGDGIDGYDYYQNHPDEMFKDNGARFKVMPLRPDIHDRVENVFFGFLAGLCSNKDATCRKGEKIHHAVKKCGYDDHSPDSIGFYDFKFRINSFVDAFQEALENAGGFTQDIISERQVRGYLSSCRFVMRYTEEGKRARSKGCNVFVVEGKETEDGSWLFREFGQRFIGEPPSTIKVGSDFKYAPKIYDPQVGCPPVTFTSPNLPSWLSWSDNTLVGIPLRAETVDVTIIGTYFHDVCALKFEIEKTFMVKIL
ncbi:hypothetical protein HDU76_012982 [Blyttiomyces sp. JEL0837]|nr:hypothetical protein HDU76_012982 [Blyttiomyces sp. JEL0837]